MTEREVEAAVAAARQYVNLSGYGYWISDRVIREVVEIVLQAAERTRAK
jgi:hypothetical protein